MFGAQMHPGFNKTHFFSTDIVSLPINAPSFISYGPSVIEENDLFTIPYRNFFFGAEIQSTDAALRLAFNGWQSNLTNYTDVMHWMVRPAYLLVTHRSGFENEVPYSDVFGVGMAAAGEAVDPQDFSQWSRFMNESWTGDKKDYGDGRVCHCDRGLPDPDCDKEGADRACKVNGRNGICFQGVCKVVEWSKNKCDIKDYGDGRFCDCGCTTDMTQNDPDCQLPMMERRCTGITSECVAHITNNTGGQMQAQYTCTADKWKCEVSKFGQDEYCECGTCSDTLVDPDCNVTLNYSSSCGSMVCINNTCAYPKYWTCKPEYYNDGHYCDCACGTFDPDCVLVDAVLRGCPDDGASYTCVRVNQTAVSACERAVCGNNRTDRQSGEECDGGEGCDEHCRCRAGYVQPGYSATFCVTVCGDKLVVGDEECDSTPFCHATACVCLPDHPLNATTGLCAGCGNGVLEDDEECDGGTGCSSECRCTSGFRGNRTVACAEDKRGLVAGVTVGSVVGALALCGGLGALVFCIVTELRKRKNSEAVEMKLQDEDFYDAPTSSPAVAPSLESGAMKVSPSLVDFGFRDGRQAPVGVTQRATVAVTNNSNTWMTFQVVGALSNKYGLRLNVEKKAVPAKGTASIGIEVTLFCTTKVSTTIGIEGTFTEEGQASRRERQTVRVELEGEPSACIDTDELHLEGIIGGGQGSCGAVRRGKWREHDVAIKVLPCTDEHALAAFTQEVGVMLSLHSDYVVQFYGGAIMPNSVCLVTQLMHNGNLSQFVAHNQLSPFTKVRIAHDIAAGMAFLHAHHLVHRNLKPTNILVASRDVRSTVVCKICDFGAARFVSDEQAAATMTSTAVTPLYTAPEMMVEHGRYSMASDVFSFGIVLAELWNETQPYSERPFDSPFAFIRHVLDGNRPSFRSDCPPDYVALAQACWTADPAARPTFAQIVARLESPGFFVSQQGPHVVPK